MFLKNPFVLALAILIYALINSVDLFFAWLEDPREKYSWIVFFIWLLPVIWSRFTFRGEKQSYFHPVLLWSAVGFSFIGEIVSMNIFKYFGLACSVASFAPFNIWLIPWILTSVAWMPVFGWLGSHYLPGLYQGLRHIVASLGVAWFIYIKKA